MQAVSLLIFFSCLARASALSSILSRLCTNPTNNWRFRQDLSLNWGQAKKAFSTAFSDAKSPLFAQRTAFGIDVASFNATSGSSWEWSAADGSYTEHMETSFLTSSCVRQSSTVKLAMGAGEGRLEVFGGLEKDTKTGTVYFVLGLNSCTPAPFLDRNFVCNEQIPLGFMASNAKRYACVVDSIGKGEGVDRCGCLMAGDLTGPLCN